LKGSFQEKLQENKSKPAPEKFWKKLRYSV
jgi:hypothetical protein